MGKTKEYYRKLKKEAHDLFVHQGMSNKEIAEKLHVSEKSISKWINEKDGLWKTERHNAVINVSNRGQQIHDQIKLRGRGLTSGDIQVQILTLAIIKLVQHILVFHFQRLTAHAIISGQKNHPLRENKSNFNLLYATAQKNAI